MLKTAIQTDFDVEDIVREAMGDLAIEFRLALEFDQRALRAVRSYLMSVMLIEGGSLFALETEAYDLRFGIRDKLTDNDFIVGDLDFSRESVAACIPKHERMQVLSLVCKAAQLLVRNVHGAEITMATYDLDLPEKALVKYDHLVEALLVVGYGCTALGSDADGRHRWRFTPRD